MGLSLRLWLKEHTRQHHGVFCRRAGMTVVEEDKERAGLFTYVAYRLQKLLQLLFAVEVVVALGDRRVEPVIVSAVEPEIAD